MEEYGEPTTEMDRLVRLVIGAAIAVHRLLGPGLPEALYEEALVVELELRGLRCERQKDVVVTYKGREIGKGRIDLLVEGKLVV